jgi:hypothetical protein
MPGAVAAGELQRHAPRPRRHHAPDDYVRELANPVKRMEIFEEMGERRRRAHGDRRAPAGDQRRQLAALDRGHDAARQGDPRVRRGQLYPLLDDCCAGSAAARCSTGSARSSPCTQWSDRPIVASLSRGKVKRATKAASGGSTSRKLAHIRQTGVRRSRSRDRRPRDVIRSTCSTAHVPPRRDPGREAPALDVQPPGRRLLGRAADAALLQGVEVQDAARAAEPPALRQVRRRHPVAEEGEGWTEPSARGWRTALKNWRAGDSYIVHPTGGKLSIVGATGKISGSMASSGCARTTSPSRRLPHADDGARLDRDRRARIGRDVLRPDGRHRPGRLRRARERSSTTA